ncbi:unnamed protein product, partial [Rotaria sp. Silwood1]
VASTEEID